MCVSCMTQLTSGNLTHTTCENLHCFYYSRLITQSIEFNSMSSIEHIQFNNWFDKMNYACKYGHYFTRLYWKVNAYETEAFG